MYIDNSGARWFKGNLHTHTTRSDGRLAPEDSIALYRENGYDFMAITDHWKPSENAVHENGMLLLSGCEYDIGQNVRDGIFHIVSIGCVTEPVLTRANTQQEVIDEIHRCGGLANLAHPCWSMNTLDQLMPLAGVVDFTEIFNSVSDLPRNCRPYSGDIIDKLAARGVYWGIAATDDTHWYGETDTCRSFILVKAEECTREAILEAIRQKNFYASQGPRMDVSFDGKKLRVNCLPEDHIASVMYYTDWVWENHRGDVGVDLTVSEYEFTAKDTMARVEITDADGRCAWSQVYHI
ncbi:MAG: CehA/McbA family metallohydrolase [Clostridia bacterium]|nr:CehA/McbA family metallohydrolase [Clostridia bacterium]